MNRVTASHTICLLMDTLCWSSASLAFNAKIKNKHVSLLAVALTSLNTNVSVLKAVSQLYLLTCQV